MAPSCQASKVALVGLGACGVGVAVAARGASRGSVERRRRVGAWRCERLGVGARRRQRLGRERGGEPGKEKGGASGRGMDKGGEQRQGGRGLA